MKILKKFINLIKPYSPEDYTNNYLAKSTDCADLERRIDFLARNKYYARY